MKRTKEYPRVTFSAKALQRIVTEFKDIVKAPGKTEFRSLTIEKKAVTWRYDTLEEFLAELDNEVSYSLLYTRRYMPTSHRRVGCN